MAQENLLERPRHAGDAAPVHEDVLRLPEPWVLHHGDVLDRPRMAYRVEGPPGAPLVAVLGGMSAHRVLAGAGGWWPQIVGPGLGIDTDRHRVLGVDYLGGRGDSATPDGTAPFPPISAFDQAAALAAIVRRLGADPLHAIVGASYGGMVALAFAANHPELVGRIVMVSAAHKAQVLSTAWRSVQRQIVREALARGAGAEGLKLARALAMATYRTAAEFSQRFGGAPRRDGGRFRFPVEDYLFARGDDYVRRYRAESFLALSESIDLHAVDPASVTVPATLVAVREDQLVPIGDVRELAARLGPRAELIEIDSLYGHDAFLKESAALGPIIRRTLAERPS